MKQEKSQGKSIIWYSVTTWKTRRIDNPRVDN
jgi:hypothetical protein